MNDLFSLWHYTVLPLLLWWSVSGFVVILLAEIEHRIVSSARVSHRAALWRLVVIVIALVPFFCVFSPIRINASMTLFRSHVTYLNRNWESKPIPILYQDQPDTAALHKIITPADKPFLTWIGFSTRLPKAELPISKIASIVLFVVYTLGFFLAAWVYRRDAKSLRRLMDSTRPVEDERLRQTLRQAQLDLGLKKEFQVRMTKGNISPFVTVGRKPVLVLPETMIQVWKAEEIRPVLVHECCHLLYADYFYEWIAQGLKIALWFHPLLFWLRIRLDETREAQCDAFAAGQCRDRKTYAEIIVRLAQMLLPFPAHQVSHSFLGKSRRLFRRIEQLKNREPKLEAFFSFEQRAAWIAAWVLVLIFVGGVHSADPVVHLYSVLEPHPQTHPEALKSLQAFRDYFEPLQDNIRIEAEFRHLFYTPETVQPEDEFPNSNIGLILDRRGTLRLCKRGELYEKEIRSRYAFPFVKDVSPVADHKLNTFDALTEDYAYRTVNWNQGEEESQNQILTGRHKNKIPYEDNPVDEWKGYWDADWIHLTQLVEEGERIATISDEKGNQVISVVPTFGIGYTFRIFPTAGEEPLPWRIETWNKNIFKECREFEYTQDRRLTKFVYELWGRHQFTFLPKEQSELSHSRKEYVIHQMDNQPQFNEAIFSQQAQHAKLPDVPELESQAITQLTYQVVGSCQNRSESELSQIVREQFSEFKPYSYLNKGYSVTNEGHKNDFNLLVSQDLLTAVTAECDSGKISGTAVYETYQMAPRYFLDGYLKEKTEWRKSVYNVPFALSGHMRYLIDAADTKRETVMQDVSIPFEEFGPDYELFTAGSPGFVTLRHYSLPNGVRYKDFCSASAPTGGRAEINVEICNFSKDDVHVFLASTDPNVEVNLPNDGRIPPQTVRWIHLAANTGTEARKYDIALTTDHRLVKQIDLEFTVYPED